MTALRRFVFVQTEVHTDRHLVHRVCELQIGRRGVHRVAADDDQHVDFAGIHVGDQIAKRGELVDRLGLDGIGVHDGGAGVAERVVHCVRESVHLRRLMIAGDDETAAAMREQIFCGRVDPCRHGGPEGPACARGLSGPTSPKRPA